MATRASAGVYPRPGRQARASALPPPTFPWSRSTAAARSPITARPTRGLPDARPAAARPKVREMVHLIRAGSDRLPRGLRVEAVRKDGAPGVLCGWRENRRAGPQGKEWLQLSRTEPECRYGSCTIYDHRPCGYSGLKTAQLCPFGVSDGVGQVGENLPAQLERLGAAT